MRQLGICVAVAVTGAAWLHWESLQAADFGTSSYRTKADAVVCETPFQIRKAIVAMVQDDGDRVRSLACIRPGSGRRVKIIAMPVTKYGPLQIQLISEQGIAATMWGYADQFEADTD